MLYKKEKHRKVCKNCNSEYFTYHDTQYCSYKCTPKRKKLEEKVCSCCGELKKREEFGKQKNGIKQYCKKCQSSRKFIKTPEDFIKYVTMKRILEKRRNGHDIDITAEYLINLYYTQQGKCAISGVDLEYIGGRGTPRIYNIITADRIDSSKGYIKGNVQLVTYTSNIMKHLLNMNEMLDLCKQIVDYNKDYYLNKEKETINGQACFRTN